MRKKGESFADTMLEHTCSSCSPISKKIVAKLLVPHKDYLEARNISLKEGTVLSMISKAKAKGQTPDDVAPAPSTSQPRPTLQSGATEAKDIQYVVSEVYREYERTLRRNNSLDFDDLLVFGLKLFSGHPTSVAWCKHVLVDELYALSFLTPSVCSLYVFGYSSQDTNITQYELMRHIAAAHGCVTVVGDPDQSSSFQLTFSLGGSLINVLSLRMAVS